MSCWKHLLFLLIKGDEFIAPSRMTGWGLCSSAIFLQINQEAIHILEGALFILGKELSKSLRFSASFSLRNFALMVFLLSPTISSCKASIVSLSRSDVFLDPFRMTDGLVVNYDH